MPQQQRPSRSPDVPEYQANTERFANWLADTAWRGGLESIPAEPVGGRYRIRLGEYTRVARFVRDIEPTPDVPKWLPTCLGLAICLRKRHQHEAPDGPDQNHSNVIELLEAVGQILLPIYSEDQKDEYLAIISSKTEMADDDSNSNAKQADISPSSEAEQPDLSQLSISQQPADQPAEEGVEVIKRKKTRRSKRGGKNRRTSSTLESGNSEKSEPATRVPTYASVVNGRLAPPSL